MTRYRLSGHTLTIETGRYRQHWLPRESCICPYCTHGEVETEQHFTSCPHYQHIRNTFYPKFETLYPDFKMLNKKTQLQYLLGEKQDCISLAARYIDACHKKREESTDAPPHTHTHSHTHIHKHTHKHKHTHTQTNTHTYTNTHTQTQTHTYTNTHTPFLIVHRILEFIELICYILFNYIYIYLL